MARRAPNPHNKFESTPCPICGAIVKYKSTGGCVNQSRHWKIKNGQIKGRQLVDLANQRLLAAPDVTPQEASKPRPRRPAPGSEYYDPHVELRFMLEDMYIRVNKLLRKP